MRTATIILASTVAIGLGLSAVAAQQQATGTIMKIDRLNSTIAIQRTQDGTVGAASGGPTEEFKVQDGAMLDAVHAGNRVTFSTGENGKTITKLQKQ
ncbi:copper-binding protein [Bradyrhizobium sp. NP1]|uniref:copper-binding protein n=1 Tax=Bradyrhizobium sp. NP1 TaxID=3049772 RepID=UPI0025A5F621|nr:copper-binding protein [Bradyrhizobium sp. NP1]WJR75222.1 copper-binding protein [Bradyrhizobium sp. NP1]